MWPRISACLGEHLCVKLVTTTDGSTLGGLLVPPSVRLDELEYGLKMSDTNFERPSCQIWSGQRALGPVWWMPKQALRLKRAVVRELIDSVAATHGVVLQEKPSAGIKAGDRILGVLPASVDARSNDTYRPENTFCVEVGVKKAAIPAPKALSQKYANFGGGFHVFDYAAAPEAARKGLQQAVIVDHAVIARNSNFIPLHSTTRDRPSGVLSRTNELNRLLSQQTEREWVAARAEVLEEEDKGPRKHSWVCSNCTFNNKSSDNPRKEGARCANMIRGYSGGYGRKPTAKMVKCHGTFTYAHMARQVRALAARPSCARRGCPAEQICL